jgi:hypothetical protein
MAAELIDAKFTTLDFYRLDEKAPLPDANAIDDAESKIGCVFSADYRHVLANYGPVGFGAGAVLSLPAGCPIGDHFSVDVVFGLGTRPVWDLAALALDTYQGQLPSGVVPIAADPGGNLLVMSCAVGGVNTVFAWDHEHREFSEEQVASAVRDLRAKGIAVENHDIGQIIYLWEALLPDRVPNPTGHGNLYGVANSFVAFVEALKPHPNYAT